MEQKKQTAMTVQNVSTASTAEFSIRICGEALFPWDLICQSDKGQGKPYLCKRYLYFKGK